MASPSTTALDGLIRSAWRPLRHHLFRWLWIASLASNVGTWVHEVAANWFMTSLAPSPLMVSLIQTAESLPVFLLALFAGALSDVVDRRRLLIFAQGWMLAAAAILGILAFAGAVTSQSLLLFTFFLSLGTAIHGPVWLAIVPEVVPREDVPPAVALTSVGLNAARAVGPALGGLIVALASPGAAFLLNAFSFLAVIVVLYRWQRRPTESVLPGERVLAAMRGGLRYVRHEPDLKAVLVRCAVFMAGASAIWALTPLYARQNLGRSAAGYGILLGCLGAGAVIGGTILPGIRQRFKTEHFLGAGTLLYGCATVSMGLWHHFALACIAMALAGAAWTTLLSTFAISIQMGVPGWVRGRALAVYHLVFFGVMAVGSAVWGAVALRVGIPIALVFAGLAVLGSLFTAFRFPVFSGEGLDLAPHALPMPLVNEEPHPDRGPVLITIEYRIDPQRAAEFTEAMRELGRTRRRDGAVRWSLFEDVAHPGRFLENFLVESWVGHLRQHERATVADRQAQERVHAFHLGEQPPDVSHYVYAYDNT